MIKNKDFSQNELLNLKCGYCNTTLTYHIRMMHDTFNQCECAFSSYSKKMVLLYIAESVYFTKEVCNTKYFVYHANDWDCEDELLFSENFSNVTNTLKKINNYINLL